MYHTHFKDELWTIQHNEEGQSANTRLAIYNCAKELLRFSGTFNRENKPVAHISGYMNVLIFLSEEGAFRLEDCKQTVWTGKSCWLNYAEVNELQYLCSAEQAGSFCVLWDPGAKNLTKEPWNSEKTIITGNIYLCKQRQSSEWTQTVDSLLFSLLSLWQSLPSAKRRELPRIDLRSYTGFMRCLKAESPAQQLISV